MRRRRRTPSPWRRSVPRPRPTSLRSRRSTARPRAARAPGWAWVAMTLMVLVLGIASTTLFVARNAEPSTPEAVEDVQTLVVELEVLNGYLATTNELMSNAIASAQQMSADAQAQLAELSAQFADADARRRTYALAPRQPALRYRALRARPGSGAASVSPTDARASGPSGSNSNYSRRSAEMSLPSTTESVLNFPGHQSHVSARGSDRGAREQAGRDRRVQDSASRRGRSAQIRGRSAQDGRSGPPGSDSGPAGRHSGPAATRRSGPRAEAKPGGAPADRRQVEPEALVLSAIDGASDREEARRDRVHCSS